MPQPQPGAAARGERPPALDERRRTVLDTSALMVLLFNEPGAPVLADIVAAGAVMSTVNLSEAAEVLSRNQRDAVSILTAVSDQVVIEPFTVEDAFAAAALRAPTRAAGLSLGDRGCLALAKRLEVSAATADRSWAKIDVGVPIQLVRHVSS